MEIAPPTMVNAVKIKLTPNTTIEQLKKFLRKKYKPEFGFDIGIVEILEKLLDKWIALVDDNRTIEKKAEKLYGSDKKKYEYFITQESHRGFGFFDVIAFGVDETALENLKSAEKKGLISVEYNFFKKIADLGGKKQ